MIALVALCALAVAVVLTEAAWGAWCRRRKAQRRLARPWPLAVGTSAFPRDGVSYREPGVEPRYVPPPNSGVDLLTVALLTSDTSDCGSGGDSGCSE